MTKATYQDIVAFCETYKANALRKSEDLSGIDDWVRWGGYEINLFGSYYSLRIEGKDAALSVSVYPSGWTDNLPESLYEFDLA